MPRTPRAFTQLPPSTAAGLEKLGADLAVARLRRRESLRTWAKRMGTTVPTLLRLESGDPGVGIGLVATALWLAGMDARLADVAAPEHDIGALDLDVRKAVALGKARATASAEGRLKAASNAAIELQADRTLIALHSEAVRLMSTRRWVKDDGLRLLEGSPSPSARVLQDIVVNEDWAALLSPTSKGARLRAVSPLASLVPTENVDDVVGRYWTNQARRVSLEPRVSASMRALSDLGVRAEVVGSYAWGDFQEHSDIDFLIIDAGTVSFGEIASTIESNLTDVKFDIIELQRLPADAARIVLDERRAHGREPLAVEFAGEPS